MSDRDRRIRDRGAAVLGIVGTGRISQTYFDTAAASPVLELKACAARSVESARPMAERFGAEPLAFEDLLADDDIDLVLNLPGLASHHAVNRAALVPASTSTRRSRSPRPTRKRSR